jgi:hypothetical protein
MTDEEAFQTWWKELSPEERARYRRQQADIDSQLAEQERLSRAGTTSRAEVAPSNPSPWPKRARDELRNIVKECGGVSKLAKLIVSNNNSHRITESEIVELAKEELDGTGKSVGELLLTDTTLQKACAIAREGEHVRQAQANIVDTRLCRLG